LSQIIMSKSPFAEMSDTLRYCVEPRFFELMKGSW